MYHYRFYTYHLNVGYPPQNTHTHAHEWGVFHKLQFQRIKWFNCDHSLRRWMGQKVPHSCAGFVAMIRSMAFDLYIIFLVQCTCCWCHVTVYALQKKWRKIFLPDLQTNKIKLLSLISPKNRDYFYIFVSSCIRTILWQTYTNDWMWTGFWAILYDRKHKIVYQFGR